MPESAKANVERKFVGTRDLADFGLSWLRHVCLPDPEFPAAVVSSVYYDTPAFDLFEEKVNGDFLKTKCRLRWYDPDVSARPDRRIAFLEIKCRIGEGRRKARARLDLDRTWLESAGLDDSRFVELVRTSARPLGEPLPPELMAVAVIRYRRHRFVCPFTLARVCLDSSIEMPRVNKRLLPEVASANIPAIVLEIKGEPAAETPWLTRLYAAGFRKRSFSKYAACIGRATGEE